MTEELAEEIDAIEAIFPECVEKLAPEIYNFVIPNHGDVTMQMSFPSSYPEEAPNIIQVITRNAILYPDNNYIENRFQEIVGEVFNPGDVVVFELLGEVEQFLEQYNQDHAEEIQILNEKLEQIHIQELKQKEKQKREAHKVSSQTTESPASKEIDHTAGWTQSDPITDRGSTFIAYAKEVGSVEEAQDEFETLISDRRIARSSHNMNAWRIKGPNGVLFQDCDDDGETAAGLRMLHLLTVCELFSHYF